MKNSELVELGMSAVIVMLILAMVYLCSTAHAFEDYAFPKPEPYVSTYHGEKDRYDIAKLQNDPEVLISKPVVAHAYFYHQPQPTEVYEKPVEQDRPITVTAQLCDDKSCTTLPAEAK